MSTPPSDASARNGFGESDIPLNVLLRAAADDELNHEGQRALAEHLRTHPENQARIEFEQSLRCACRRVMASESQPPSPGLRDRVESILKATRGVDEPVSVQHPPHTRPPFGRDHRRSRIRLLIGVLAAIVAIAVGVQVSGILRTPTFAESPEKARLALAGFLGNEHRRCSLDDRALKRKMTEYHLSEAPAKYKKLLGAELSVADVEKAGYSFLGAGRCVVPGSGASVHLVFCEAGTVSKQSLTDLTCDPSRLSLFIQKDTGELPIVTDTTYRLESVENGPLVVVWLRGGLVYYLVTETKAAEDTVLDHLGIVPATRPL